MQRHRDAEARRLAEADVARDHGARTPGRGSARARRARRRGRVACGRRASSAPVPRRSAAGSARAGPARSSRAPGRGPRARSTPSAPGTITRSAATSALTVSGPSDGGQSIRTYAKRLAQRRERLAQPPLGPGDRRQLDRRAGQLDTRRDQREQVDRRLVDRRARPRTRRTARRTRSGAACAAGPATTVALHCGSRSTSSVGRPAPAMQAARLTAVVVLPTPPFWLAIANVVTRDTLAGRGDRAGAGGARRTRAAAHGNGRRRAARSALRPPSGRLRATPARRGNPAGVGATLRYTCRWCATLPAYGSVRTTSARLAARAARGARRRPPPPPPATAPFQATSDPPSASSGAAYSQSTASGASARATTRSCAPSPSAHSSARARTTRALPIPAAAHSRARNSHLRAALSTSATRAPRQRDREHESREAGARAEVGDRPGVARRSRARAR